jgi:hypothetical protein
MIRGLARFVPEEYDATRRDYCMRQKEEVSLITIGEGQH